MVDEWEVRITAVLRFPALRQRDARIVASRAQALLVHKLAPFLLRKQRIRLIVEVGEAERTGRQIDAAETADEKALRMSRLG